MSTIKPNNICTSSVLSDLEFIPPPNSEDKNNFCPWVFPSSTIHPPVKTETEYNYESTDDDSEEEDEFNDELIRSVSKSQEHEQVSYTTDIYTQNVSVDSGSTVHIGPSVSTNHNYNKVRLGAVPSYRSEPSTSTSGCSSCSSGVKDNNLAVGDVSVKGDDNKVHFGTIKNQSSYYNIGEAKFVEIKHYQVCQYPRCVHPLIAPQPSNVVSDSQVKLVKEVKIFLQQRYKNRMSNIHPLPWSAADFRLHLDVFYTTLQLVTGNRRSGHTDEEINIEKILNGKNEEGLPSGRSSRVLIEGNPGYGKSTLTLRIANDWASGKPYVHRFTLVFLIQLRDFQSDLKDYISKELYPQERERERESLWDYMRDNQENILFILDGLDELPRDKQGSIDALLKGNLFDKATVIVTSRPVSNDNSVLSVCSRRIALRGFSQQQTEQFVRKYFEMHKKPECATRLLAFVFAPRSTCRHLASCPLTCLLLCVLFDDIGDTLLTKVTDVYRQLVKCLVRRANPDNNKRHGNNDKSEKALNNFGELCLQCLARDTFTFTYDELYRALHSSADTLLSLGLLVQSCTLQSSTRIQKEECYQLLHKTFLEFLAAKYLYSLTFSKNAERFQHEFLTLQSVGEETLRLVLKFLVGLLGEKAHMVIERLPELNLREYILYELLEECGSSADNVKALSSVLSEDFVTVLTNQLELEAWAGILALLDCKIQSVKLQWVSQPPLESLALDAFVTALLENHSVTTLTVTSSMGLQLGDTEIATLANYTARVLRKPGLKHFSIELPGDTYSLALSEAIANTFLLSQIPDLSSVALAVDLNDVQLQTLCGSMVNLPGLKNVSFTKLSCGPEGYQALGNLLVGNRALDQLKVSVHLFKPLPSIIDQMTSGSPEGMTQWEPFLIKEARRRIDGLSAREKLAMSIEKLETHELTQEAHTSCKESEEEEACTRSASTNSTASTPESSTDELVEDDYKNQDENYLPNFDALNLNENDVQSDSALKLTTISTKPRKPKRLACTRGRAFTKENLRSKQSDSTVQPSLPFAQQVCTPELHLSGFHSLISALKDTRCHLKRLDLTNCLLKAPDMVCLSQSLAINTTLKALRVADLRDVDAAMAIVETLLYNTSLTWLDLTSFKLQLDARQTEHVLRILTSRSHEVHQLSLAGWSFQVEDAALLTQANNFMNSKTCPLQELNLSDCHLYVRLCPTQAPNKAAMVISTNVPQRKNSKDYTMLHSPSSFTALPALVLQRPQEDFNHLNEGRLLLNGRRLGKAGPWPSIEKLALSGTSVTVSIKGQRRRTFRGLRLLQQLQEFTNLKDLRLDTRPEHEKPETLDDDATRDTFRYIARKFGHSLRKLHISGWHFCWSKPEQTTAVMTNELRKCQLLDNLKLNFVRYCVGAVQGTSQERTRKPCAKEREESHGFLKAVAQGLPYLREVSLIGMEINELQALQFAGLLRSKWPKEKESLRLHVRLLGPEAERALIHGLGWGLKLLCTDVGGMQGTWLVKRRQKLCGALLTMFRREVKQKYDEYDQNDNDHPGCSRTLIGNHVTQSSFVFDLGILSAHYVA